MEKVQSKVVSAPQEPQAPALRQPPQQAARSRETEVQQSLSRWRRQVVGGSPGFLAALEQAAIVSSLDVHVLLSGDSGTGKTQLARLIHGSSRRASGPLVELNCATLPDGLVESELFGAAAGAHSTARVDVPGKIAAARHGTLFLDEVGELPLGSQAKLLQFLQTGEYYPLGSTQVRTANVRVISASNVDLHAAVADKRFRADLLYRLEVIPIRLPSLAERPGDIQDLAALFCRRAVTRHNLPQAELTPAALLAIEAARWPGNIRQLEHAVEAAVIRASGTGVVQITSAHVFPGLAQANDESRAIVSFQEATRTFQSGYLRRTLRECGWNVSECSRRLELARSHAYNLIREFGLQREDAA